MAGARAALGRGQAVRRGTLDPVFGGSNPPAPTTSWMVSFRLFPDRVWSGAGDFNGVRQVPGDGWICKPDLRR